MQIRRYLQKLSGPLLDRVDIRTFVEAPTRAELVSENLAETSEVVRRRVIAARNAAQERFKDCPWNMNSEIPPKELRVRFKAEKSGMTFLHNELESERLSARGFHKILRLAWSIADKRGHFIPSREDVEAAYRLREGMELFR
jgi:magnesium chelatase family protein